MSNFSVGLDPKRPWRYAFHVRLWDKTTGKFRAPVLTLLDTGAFNTIIHKELASTYGIILNKTMHVSIGGYKGDADLCIIHKMNIGNMVIENILALAVSFKGELKDHILLGANVTNNWDVGFSRRRNVLHATEDFPHDIPNRKYPYRYCYDNKGRIIAVQEMEPLN
ncbi:MAG: retroviral-like aspartic protease family protein [Defluviitaleaceae bacterium]|nr:retroviral-like aspartic protease family protein [Defluviitaleaceae bacterium]